MSHEHGLKTYPREESAECLTAREGLTLNPEDTESDSTRAPYSLSVHPNLHSVKIIMNTYICNAFNDDFSVYKNLLI